MRYVNPYQRKICRGLTHFLLWQLGYYNDPSSPKPLPTGFSYPNPLEEVDFAAPTVTWVNHSTFWVQAFGKSLLVDPIWNQRCSPFPFVGPKRYHKPLPALDAINTLDAVIISHNHYDHLDRYTISALLKHHPQAFFLVAEGMKRWFQKRFPQAQVQELSWWQSIEHKEMAFTATPAQHFSGRGLFDRNRTHWMGCIVRFNGGKQFYFAGDTGYNAFDFKQIRKTFADVDLSLLPIGVYRPRAFMKAVHVNPRESIQIHTDVGSKLSVAGHFGTFRLSSEEIERPPFDLYSALSEASISPHHFRVLKPGQTINW